MELAFSGLRVLNGVSFSVGRGQLFAIIGPNGAGKTSLFNCISGLYRPTKGRLLFRPDDVTELDLAREPAPRIADMGVGRTFQNIALFENLTVLENLLVGRHQHVRYSWLAGMLRLPGMVREESAHRRRVEEIIDLLDLTPYRRLPVAALPYGVLKRVELGRALATEPKLLLLDEPAAGLNQEEREDMARTILEVRDHLHVSQILIEHDMAFVMDLSDEVLALNFGTVLCHGDPHSVAQHPDVQAAYLGTAAAAVSGEGAA